MPWRCSLPLGLRAVLLPSHGLAMLPLGSHSQMCLDEIAKQKKKLGEVELHPRGKGPSLRCRLTRPQLCKVTPGDFHPGSAGCPVQPGV